MAARARTYDDTQTKPRSDAYVGLLFIALLAQIVAAVFFYLDWSQFPSSKPTPPPTVSAPASGPGPGGPAPAPAPAPGPGRPGPAGPPK
jgi:hypothetical protein